MVADHIKTVTSCNMGSNMDISTYYLLRAFLEFTQTLLGIWPLTKSGSEKWSYVGLCRLSHEISQLFRCGLM